VPQDYKEAAKWYRLASDHGNGDAQYDLALMYAAGHGVPQDYKQAAVWYRKAADQGNVSAQLNLGALYYAGQGVPKAPKDALKYFRMAAQAGNGRAQFNLATLYTNGDAGIPQDLSRALIWFNAASVTLAGNDSKIADENGKAVAAKMTREQIRGAQEIGRKCKVGDYKACD
jgi:TPR repeat protein